MADDIPEIDIKARQRRGKAHVEVEVPMQQEEQKEGQKAESDDNKSKDDKKQEGPKEDSGDDGLTIAGYKLGELVKAPLEPPDEKEVGKRSPKTE